MIQLGISAFYHDSAACIVKDGKVLAAVEEERFTGIKHDDRFPIESISWLLKHLELTIDDIDQVCWYENPDLKKERVIKTFNKHPFRTLCDRYKFLKRHKFEGNIEELLLHYLNYSGPIAKIDHHISHAMFSYKTSPYKDAVVVSVDGVGEWDTVTIANVKDGHMNLLSSTRFPHSLGMFYSTFTAFLGFKPNEGEYKVMGLAPYGDPNRFYGELMSLFQFGPKGTFTINQRFFTWEYSDKIMFNMGLCEFLGIAPRLTDEPMKQEHKDLAAAVQQVYTDVFMYILEWAKEASGATNLCLSGGCAYNGVANNRAYELFDSVWIPFAPSDSGSAIGACLAAWPGESEDNTSPYLGPDYDDAQIEAVLYKYIDKIQFQQINEVNLMKLIANEIHAKKVIGWFQGRMEFGARALGNRSILASPLDPIMKDRLNQVIKKREGFRPFAPSCTVEDAPRYFDVKEPIPYMNQVVKVKTEWDLPSITHKDGTARVQTVSHTQNDRYYKLLRQLEIVSGFPIVLNTSFNFKDQTITMTPEQAVERFLDCKMDVLVINNFYIIKK